MVRAIQVQVPGGPECLREVTLPDRLPGAGQVRVKAHAIGVGRADVLIRQGTYKWMPPLPAVPGAELAGVIDAIGPGIELLPGVPPWQIGDRVLVSARELSQRGGCYVDAIVVPQDAPYRLPETVSFDDAVNLPNLQLAMAMVRVAGVAGGVSEPDRRVRSVLITGATGGVATMLSRWAQHLGFVTIGTSRKAVMGDMADTPADPIFDPIFDPITAGFDHLISAEPADWPARVLALTGGRGVDVVFDHLGGASLIAGLHCLAPLGTALSYNVVQGAPSEDVFQVLRSLLGKSLALRCFSMHTLDADRDERRALMQSAIGAMAAGHVKPPPPHRYPMANVQRIHELLNRGAVRGKIVMQP
jgi:NADPH:quinone reductase